MIAQEIIYPIIVAAFLGTFGWLLRNTWQNIEDAISELKNKMDALSNEFDDKYSKLERRVVRLESWKELLTLPHARHNVHQIEDEA